jgi:hypothetical protein
MDRASTDFAGAFAGPQLLRDAEGQPIETRVVAIGSLPIVSGTVAVGDPYTGMHQLAVDDGRASIAPPAIPRGEFPVDLCIARFADGDERVACARLRFTSVEAVRWERTGAAAGVDSGHAGFADRADLPRWEEDAFLGQLAARFDALDHAVPTWDAFCGKLGPTHLALFASGLGDGIYEAFWGWAADGSLVELVVDFDLLMTEDVAEVVVGAPERGWIHSSALAAAGASAKVPWLALGKRLVLKWRGRYVYARWRHGDGRYERLPARSAGDRWATYDISSPPPHAELCLALVRARIPMPRDA